MREWYRELREDYNVSRSYHEGFCEWYIKRKAPDSVKFILSHAILLFSIYLWTNFVLCMILIGIGSVACIVLELYEWIRDIRIAYQKKKIENQLKRDWAKSLENRRKHYKILKQDFIVLFSLIN